MGRAGAPSLHSGRETRGHSPPRVPDRVTSDLTRCHLGVGTHSLLLFVARWRQIPRGRLDLELVKGLKKKKDPEAPKSKKTSYLIYANEVRDGIRKSNPKKSISDITKIIGAQWNALTEQEKQKYIELANTDKERYEQEYHQYEQNLFKMSSAFSGAGSMHAQDQNTSNSLTDVNE